jgi:hypothetical protein
MCERLLVLTSKSHLLQYANTGIYIVKCHLTALLLPQHKTAKKSVLLHT